MSLPRPTSVIGAIALAFLSIIASHVASAQSGNLAISAIALQADGRVVIAGQFSAIGGVARHGVARLEPDGRLDNTFDPGLGANGSVDTLALQPDGKVVVAGDFTTFAGMPRNRVARLNSDGSLDQSFSVGAGPDDIVRRLLVDSSGRVIVAGRFESFNGLTRHYLARLNNNGSVDATFDAGRTFTPVTATAKGVTDLALYLDGRLIVAGLFGADGTYDLVRVASDGTVDHSFRAVAVSIQAVAVQSDGKVLVSGYVNHAQPNGGLTRLNPDGSTDSSFQSAAPNVFGAFIRVQSDGRVLFVGSSGPVARYEPDGSDDAGFGGVNTTSTGGTGESFRAIELQPDGRILLAGSFSTVNGTLRPGLVRLFQNGSVDPSFVPEAGVVVASSLGLNLSTRGDVDRGDGALIAGFVIDGATSKRVLIRALGPSLAEGSGAIERPLANPGLELRDSSGTVLGRNDDWRTTQTGGLIAQDQSSEIQASTVAPTNPFESAIIVTLQPGDYTTVVTPAIGAAGVGLVELYDLDAASSSRLANISTRGKTGAGEDALIAGIILGGSDPSRVLVRALGPSLIDAGVTDAIADPSLTLFDKNGEALLANDDWAETQRQEIQATGIPPRNEKEAALIATLKPGGYTAVVRDVNGVYGTALVETYALQSK